jgi:hypothetical protein
MMSISCFIKCVFFEKKEGIIMSPPKVNIRINKYLKEFILQGGFDVE